MTADQKAQELGIDFADFKPSATLASGVQVGNLIFMSGQVSNGYKGKLGQDMTTEQGQAAARVCAVQLLQAAYTFTGTLNKLRVVKLLGMVNCTGEFTESHLVINGASDLLWDIFGKTEGTRGFHARSAVGFVSLPLGFAVEIEAIFEVVDGE